MTDAATRARWRRQRERRCWRSSQVTTPCTCRSRRPTSGLIGPAMVAVRRLCDLAADIDAIEAGLGRVPSWPRSWCGAGPGCGCLVRSTGGRSWCARSSGSRCRSPAARTLLGRIVERCGTAGGRLREGGGSTGGSSRRRRRWPTADLDGLGLTGRRVATLRAAAEAAASGELLLEPGDDLHEARTASDGTAGNRPVDGGVRRDAGAGRPGRVARHRSGAGARAASDIDTETAAPVAGVRRDYTVDPIQRGAGMSLRGWTIETPEAPWSVVVDGDVVVASGFCALDELVAAAPGCGGRCSRASLGTGGGRRTGLSGRGRWCARRRRGAATRRGVPAAGLGGDAARSRPGRPGRYAELATKAGRPAAIACGRHRLCAEPGGAVRAVPPGGAVGRVAGWLCLRAAGEAMAAGPRGCLRTLLRLRQPVSVRRSVAAVGRPARVPAGRR